MVNVLLNTDWWLDMVDFIVNSFQLPNSVIDELLADLTGAELKCYLYVLRKTKGWNKEEDSISVSQFMKVTGLSNRKVIDACERLVELGLLEQKIGSNKIKVFSVKDYKTSSSEESSLVKKVHSGSEESSLSVVKKVHTQNNNINNTTKNNNNNTRTAKTNVKDLLAEYGVTGQLADEFIDHRKFRKAPITKRVMTLIANNARIAGIETSFAIEIILAKGTWVTFDATWNWQSTASSLRNEKGKTGKFDAHNGLRDRDLGETEIPSWALDGESEV